MAGTGCPGYHKDMDNDALGDSYYADLLLPHDHQSHFTSDT
jgi:hypothetical protein